MRLGRFAPLPAFAAAMLMTACSGGGTASVAPRPTASAFVPASSAITTLGAAGGNLGSTVLPGSPAAEFIVQSASQPGIAVASSQPQPALIAQSQVIVSETAGLSTVSVARVSPQAVAEAHRLAALDGLHELPPALIGVEGSISQLPALAPRARVASGARVTKASLGDQRTFKVLYVTPGAASGACPNPVPTSVCYVNVPATLAAISQHAYVWVDNLSLGNTNEFPKASYFSTTASNFDQYYSIETQAFGGAWASANVTQYPQCDANANPLPQSAYEAIPDMTGTDPHLHVLITDALPAGAESGYFYSGNLFAQNILNCSPIPRGASNELPMLVIHGATYPPSAQRAQYNPSYWLATDMPRTLSHEFQHYLHAMNKYYSPLATGTQTIVDNPWIDEGCSLLAEDLAANGMQIDTPGYSYLYLLEPSQFSLTSFIGYQPNPATATGPYNFYYYTAGNYGAAYLFIRYLYDRFGGANALHAIYGDFRPGTPGLSNVNPVLAAAGNESWPQLFGEWSIAVAAQSTGITTDPRYGFAPALVLRGTVQIPSSRNPPLQTRTLVFGGPQPPETFDPSGNLLGYVTLTPGASPTIRALDGAVNFFALTGTGSGATVRAQTGTLNVPQGALVQGNMPTPMPTSF